jgi:hypothetical protein
MKKYVTQWLDARLLSLDCKAAKIYGHNVVQFPKKSTWRDDVIGARELCDQVFPPKKWIIPGLFPEGVSLPVSRPKFGKELVAPANRVGDR